ncbi:MAG TPA: AI-2E family transporter [Candidatus Angelobacter sp.]
MAWRDDIRTTGTALKHWFIAMCYDALCVAGIWFVGLLIIRFPVILALLWAVLGGLLQFIPNFGPVIAVIGPAFTAAIMSGFSDFMRLLYVLILFAVVMVVDGLFLQPFLMKRTAKVPFWASLITPIVLGIIIPFWGVLIAPPLLAVIYAFKRRNMLGSSRSR